MGALYYPDRWSVIVTGTVTYVGTETLLDGRTAHEKECMKAVEAVRFDVKVRATMHSGTERERRVFKEFWCLYLGERPVFLEEGTRVMALVEPNRRYLGEGATTWDSAYLAHLILNPDHPLPENGPESSLDLFVHALAKVGA